MESFNEQQARTYGRQDRAENIYLLSCSSSFAEFEAARFSSPLAKKTRIYYFYEGETSVAALAIGGSFNGIMEILCIRKL